MKRIISLLLIVVMVCSLCVTAFATNDYTQGTQVVYTATGSESYTITVPAELKPGQSGTVTLSGTWAANRVVTVTADETVTLTNSINANDQKVLDVTFLGISEAGSNTGTQTFTETVSVSAIQKALFGTWSGKFYYNVEFTSARAEISVQATDKNGNDLNAQSFIIDGSEKDELLTQLKQSDLVDENTEVDALIEVKSDDFDDLADTTFDVSSIAQPGDKVIILHFNEETNEWEYVSEETVDNNGKVNANFESYSPVAFVVVKPDGTIVPVGEMFYYNTWYRNTEAGVSIAVTEDGVCFVETVDMVIGTPQDITVVNGIIYNAGQVMGEIVDSRTIKTYNLATNDYAAGYITYICDPLLDEEITSYIIAELPDGYFLAHINNECDTWAEMIDSDYSRMLTTMSGSQDIEIRHKAFIDLNGYVYYDFDGISPIKYNGQKVKVTDTIVSQACYYVDGPDADATHQYIYIGDNSGDTFIYMPGLTWGEWLQTTYNGHYCMVMESDVDGYVTYLGNRIYPEGHPDKLAHIDDLIEYSGVYLFAN